MKHTVYVRSRGLYVFVFCFSSLLSSLFSSHPYYSTFASSSVGYRWVKNDPRCEKA